MQPIAQQGRNASGCMQMRHYHLPSVKHYQEHPMARRERSKGLSSVSGLGIRFRFWGRMAKSGGYS